VFRVVVESYPDSANAHDSYGEALWRAGEIEAARRQYERAVELDPDGFVGRHASSMLERVRAGQPPP
jgi:Flp pilus assembly protein TadD